MAVIAVVTQLERVSNAITAARRAAVGSAGIWMRIRVARAVVAGFGRSASGVNITVATGRGCAAAGRTIWTVVRENLVAIIAQLTRVNDAVAAQVDLGRLWDFLRAADGSSSCHECAQQEPP